MPSPDAFEKLALRFYEVRDERDAALATIEALQARVKELEAGWRGGAEAAAKVAHDWAAMRKEVRDFGATYFLEMVEQHIRLLQPPGTALPSPPALTQPSEAAP